MSRSWRHIDRASGSLPYQDAFYALSRPPARRSNSSSSSGRRPRRSGGANSRAANQRFPHRGRLQPALPRSFRVGQLGRRHSRRAKKRSLSRPTTGSTISGWGASTARRRIASVFSRPLVWLRRFALSSSAPSNSLPRAGKHAPIWRSSIWKLLESSVAAKTRHTLRLNSSLR